MKKSHLLITAIVLTGVIAGAGATYAASNTNSETNFMSNLANAIAQKFNLNPSDVQQVINDQKTQMIAQRQADVQQRMADRLVAAVKNGQLSQDQADKITAKQKEVQDFIASLSGKTPAERRTAMQQEMTSLRQWATDNNIPHQYLMFGGFKMGRGHGMMGREMRAFQPTTTTNTQIN